MFYGLNLLPIPERIVTNDGEKEFTVPKGYYGFLQMSVYASSQGGSTSGGYAAASANSGTQWVSEGTIIKTFLSAGGSNSGASVLINGSATLVCGTDSRGSRNAVWSLSLFKIHQ